MKTFNIYITLVDKRKITSILYQNIKGPAGLDINNHLNNV